MAEIEWTIVSCVSISELKEEAMTRGTSYKFSLLNQSIIRSLWEIGHNFGLKNPNQVKPMAFERRFKVLLHGQISDTKDPKSQR